MNTGIFLRPSDIQKLEDCGHTWAWKTMRTIKDSLGKLPHQKLSLAEYASYHGIKEEEVKKALGKKN